MGVHCLNHTLLLLAWGTVLLVHVEFDHMLLQVLFPVSGLRHTHRTLPSSTFPEDTVLIPFGEKNPPVTAFISDHRLQDAWQALIKVTLSNCRLPCQPMGANAYVPIEAATRLPTLPLLEVVGTSAPLPHYSRGPLPDRLPFRHGSELRGRDLEPRTDSSVREAPKQSGLV